MVYLNEWFPNPVGPDAAGEFVELYNNSPRRASLEGWHLGIGTASTTTQGKQIIIPSKRKPFSLSGYSIAAKGYLVLRHTQDHLTLKNTNGAVMLYGPNGSVADEGWFYGSAPQGQSVSRAYYDHSYAQHFAFNDPTPGAANAPLDRTIHVEHYPVNVPLSKVNTHSARAGLVGNLGGPIWSGFGVAVILAVSLTYAFKANEAISRTLFGRNETPRGDARERTHR